MIRINLLPFRAARKRENIRQQVSIFILLIIFLVLGLSYYSILLDKKIKTIQSKIVSVEQKIAKVKKDALRVNQIKKAISVYKKKVKTIQSLKRRRREIIVLLDNMTELIIPERMWLGNLNIKRNKVVISGTAFDQKIVADFMTKLEESPLFKKDVKLNSLTLSKLGTGITVQKFSLTCIRTAIQTKEKIKQ